jgi:hypothetical protein
LLPTLDLEEVEARQQYDVCGSVTSVQDFLQELAKLSPGALAAVAAVAGACGAVAAAVISGFRIGGAREQSDRRRETAP